MNSYGIYNGEPIDFNNLDLWDVNFKVTFGFANVTEKKPNGKNSLLSIVILYFYYAG